MVVKGTAPEECTPQMKKLRKNPVPNTVAGKNVAVWNKKKVKSYKIITNMYAQCTKAAAFFQLVPFNVLNILAAW